MEKQAERRVLRTFSVLVVDSHGAVRSTLASRLRLAPGVEWVKEAATVDEAKRVVYEAWPDIVLFDPGGWQGDWRAQLGALTAIRPKGAIIALHLARSHNGYTGEARTLGADCIVLKGLKTNDLVDILAREVEAASQ